MRLNDLTSKFKVSLDNWCNYYYLSNEKLNAFRTELNNPTTLEKINSLFQNKNENVVSLIQIPSDKIAFIGNNEAIQIANITCTTNAVKIDKTDLTKLNSLGLFYPKQLFTIPEDLTNTEINLWAPYVGFIALDVEKIFNYNVCELIYLINLNDCSCVAYVLGKKTVNDYDILYQKEGQVGRSVSFGGRNTEKELKALKGLFASSLAMFAGGFSNNFKMLLGGTGAYALSALNYAKTDFNLNVNTQKYNDVNAPQHAYLSIIRRKINTVLYNSETFKNTIGYKTNILKKLNTLTGFTQCSNFNLNNFNIATKQELELITKYLTSGIIL